MYIVVVPLIILFGIIFIKKIPKIGGNIRIAIILTGLAALLVSGIFNPVKWLLAWVDGLSRMAWVIFLIIFGGLYAEESVRIGTMDTVLNSFRSAFGRKPKGLIVCVIISLAFAGALIGDATAVAAVIGVLIIAPLDEMGLKPEQTVACVVCGSALGSIMPPITQAIFLASSFAGANEVDVVKIGYFTVGLGTIITCLYMSNVFVKIKTLPEDLIPDKSVGQILKEGIKSLIPLMVLIALVALRTGFKIDIATMLFGPVLSWLSNIPIAKGLSNLMVVNMLMAAIVGLFYKPVYKDIGGVLKSSIKTVWPCISVLFCTTFMVGAFYNAGQVEAVANFATSLAPAVVKIGGAIALMLLGMLTGSQTTAQNTIYSLLAPALLAVGVSPTLNALGGSHLAMAGQGMPPACLTTFAVVGLVRAITKKEADPLKSMLWALPQNLYFMTVGILAWFI